jgi:type IV secretory pathway VirB10-like protein
VAEAARPQLAYTDGVRKTGRALGSAQSDSTDLCCDRCETWYTTSEVGISADEAEALATWVCGICLGTHRSRDSKPRAKVKGKIKTEAELAHLAAAPSPSVERKRPAPPPGPPPDARRTALDSSSLPLKQAAVPPLSASHTGPTTAASNTSVADIAAQSNEEAEADSGSSQVNVAQSFRHPLLPFRSSGNSKGFQ